jgi:imidazolonepropionase
LHADELAPSGGAELAAEVGALSADHLAVPSDAGIDALASAAASGSPVVAVVLPATTWFLMHEEVAPARTFIDRGIPVALATDFNPGTSPTASLPFVMTVACVELKLSPSEVLAAVTVNAAAALGLGDEIGSIETGRQADLAIWNVPTHRQIPYWPAADLVRAVVKKGSVVLERAPA